jgi:hypothetical protein
VSVPFSLAHGAAALPFRRFSLIFSALLIGTFAPDFEYFLRLRADDGFGHTLLGAFVLTVPLALLVLWIFHAFVKRPVAGLLPEALQCRLAAHLDEFRFWGTARFALIVGSILLGICTHLVWDSFTHPNTWLYRHCSLLSQLLDLPVLGPIPVYKILQHASTLVGTGVLLIWGVLCYRASEPSGEAIASGVSSVRKITICATVAIVALAGSLVRAFVGVGIPRGNAVQKQFGGLLVVTRIALIWWQLVAYGILSARGLVGQRR